MTENSINSFLYESTDVEIDHGVELIVEIEGVYGHMKSELVGQRTGHYLVIRTPVGPAGYKNKLFDGNNVLVRYLRQDMAYGFQSSILKSIVEPEQLLFIACPRVLQERTLRSVKRVDTYIVAKVAVQAQSVAGTIVDMSAKGCRCIVPSHVEHTKQIELHNGDPVVIYAELDGEEVHLAGWIRNLMTYHGATKLGIEFDRLPQETREQLFRYLRNELELA